MKPFESFLAPQLEAYLTYRRNLGYRTNTTRSLLLVFDRYLLHTLACHEQLTPSFFLKLRTQLTQEPRTVNEILSCVRGFFRFLIRQGIYEENPLQDIPSLPEKYYIPFIFSADQIEQLLSAACARIRKSEKYFLIDLAVYVTLLLLARCGMRMSEPLRLARHHYRPEEGTLYIEKTKFRKDRLIPVPRDAWTQIDNYLAIRHALAANDPNPYLLAGTEERPLTDDRISRFFARVVKDIGVEQPRRIVGQMIFGRPTPHCLRHSLATNTLKRIREQGKNPQHALPVLAAYLGHQDYRRTAVYLKLTDANNWQALVEFAKAFQEFS